MFVKYYKKYCLFHCKTTLNYYCKMVNIFGNGLMTINMIKCRKVKVKMVEEIVGV